jgi:methionyl aminopeptidase
MIDKPTIKNSRQIKIMRQGGQILAKIVKEIKSEIKIGKTTKEIERIAKELFKKYQVRSSFLGHNQYPAEICISINDELVHGIPSNRQIKDGDLVSVDIGIFCKGFHTDTAFTVGMGEISKKDRKLIDATRAALLTGIRQARPGNRIGDISFAIQKKIESAGFSVIRDCTGHGIGSQLHEKPTIPNFGVKNSGLSLSPGMTIAIEPMSAEKGYEIRILKDGWTIATKDAGKTAHFEDTILITPNGPQILTKI